LTLLGLLVLADDRDQVGEQRERQKSQQATDRLGRDLAPLLRLRRHELRDVPDPGDGDAVAQPRHVGGHQAEQVDGQQSEDRLGERERVADNAGAREHGVAGQTVGEVQGQDALEEVLLLGWGDVGARARRRGTN
jgi:hypothetical protein